MLNALVDFTRAVANLGTCARRQIGCALFKKDWQLLSTGFNGPLRGVCECPGKSVPAGAGNADCYGIHAEIRALLEVKHPNQIAYCISTKAPCKACTLALLGTTCENIYFLTASNETENRDLWEKAGRKWIHYEANDA